MQTLTFRFLLLTFLMGAQNSDAQLAWPHVEYGPADGLPFNYFEHVIQDNNGFIWIKSADILSRFDGYEFKNYSYVHGDSLLQLYDDFSNITVDQRGGLWVNYMINQLNKHRVLLKYDPTKDGFIRYEPKINTNVGNTIVAEDDGRLWLCAIGLESDGWYKWHSELGLYEFDPVTGATTHYFHSDKDSLRQLRKNFISSVDDRDSCLYLITRDGLWKFDKTSRTYSRPSINPKDSTILFGHSCDLFWRLAPGMGYERKWIHARDKQTKKAMSIRLDSVYNIVAIVNLEHPRLNKPEAIGSVKVDADKQDNLWYKADGAVFRHDYKTDRTEQLVTNETVDWFNLDREGNVWAIVSNGHKLYKYPYANFQYRKTHLNNIWPAVSLTPKAGGGQFAMVTTNTLYGSGWSSGLWMGEFVGDSISFRPLDLGPLAKSWVAILGSGPKNLYLQNMAFGMVGIPIDEISERQVPPEVFNHFGLGRNKPFWPQASYEDSFGNLWIASGSFLGWNSQGLMKINNNLQYGIEGSLQRFAHIPGDTTSLSHDTVHDFLPWDNASMLVSTGRGVDLFSHGKFQSVFRNESGAYTLCRTPDGNLYVSSDDGMFRLKGDLKNKEFVKVADGFCGDFISDRQNRLWIMTPRGIEMYDPKSDAKLTLGPFADINVVGAPFNVTILGLDNGLVAAVVEDGVVVFDPDKFQTSANQPRTALTKLLVDHKPVNIAGHSLGSSDFQVTNTIEATDLLTLDYLHNNFAIEFAALEMAEPKKNMYRHKLEGYDNDWIETDYKERKAYYTNLPAGDYVFKVKASNHHGVWSDYEKTLTIRILPPPWRTWWAYTGYSFLVAGLLVWARRNIIQRERLKSNFRMEHLKLEKAEEVDRVKTSFFTNISHEFRTPLTLIQGPVNEMLEQFKDNPKVQQRMKLAQHNSDLLLKLINQLLDLSKLEAGTLKVEKANIEVHGFVRAVASSFESIANQKRITLKVKVSESPKPANIDRDKLETIVINLVNNAIKFTPAGGTVEVDCEAEEGSLTLEVTDTGIGIPKDKQNKIFERFYQVSDTHKEVGTGIGLALVKELVALLGGKIEVKSEPGLGSKFVVTLPVEPATGEVGIEAPEKEKSAFISELLDNGISPPVPKRYVRAGNREQGTPNVEVDSIKPQVLVVEDNTDLRHFIIDCLGDEFDFIESDNGKKGIENATSNVPDIIISDVMMPEMDGITMTGKLKADVRTSHIPLILLTAKSTEDSKLHGLSSGADDYLTKPFNKNELLLKVRNSITRQQKLREKLRADLISTAPKVSVLSADEQFLEKVKSCILARLSDEQLSVESLAEEIGMSRVQLYRKLTALTGMSVNELIRKLRLQRAAYLLEEKWGPVSQVAYEVGFSNLSYFSKVFKEEFGILPSEYAIKA